MVRRFWVVVLAVSSVTAMSMPGRAQAFDTYAHANLTSSALTAEGFSGDAAALGEVMNWFPDLYHFVSADKMPASGQAGWLERLLLPSVRSENWPESVISAATRSHFYGVREAPGNFEMQSLGTTEGMTAEWERLQRAVGAMARQARDENNPEMLVELLGMSLHPLQDFYSHTNWVEPIPYHLFAGTDGPGWAERGYGSNPTWFDLPASVRNEFRIYGAETAGHRVHGIWDADGNASLTTGMAKDWPGRPLHQQAVVSAYFASRQWVEALRSWVNDDAFWQRAQNFHPVSTTARCELNRDLMGMHEIMFSSGQWQGEGEPTKGASPGPGGNLLDLRDAVNSYFSPVCRPSSPVRRPSAGKDHRHPTRPTPPAPPRYTKTRYRAQFERLVLAMADPAAGGPAFPVASSARLQAETRFVGLRLKKLQAEELGDVWPDDADMYANVRINDEPSSSAEINSRDTFAFPRPFAPFTWFQAVPAVTTEQEPVESIEVEVRTADVLWAGTDDDVYLHLGPGIRVPLDKRLYNDFESGDRDNYNAPIDDLVAPGIRSENTTKISVAPIGQAGLRSLRVGDITEIGIEKSGDGVAGGWKLGGIKVRVNGQPVYSNPSINRWLEDDHRRWIAPDFQPSDPRGTKVPVSVFIADDDSNVYGADDPGDLNYDDHRRVFSIGYPLGEYRSGSAKGGGRLGGRIGFEHGDKASVMYSIETIVPIPPPTDSQPLPREEGKGAPDLVLGEASVFGVQVINQGNADAGPFRVRAVNGLGGQVTATFPGLAAGEFDFRTFPLSCFAQGQWTAVADDLGQVAESNEFNNEMEFEEVIC